MQALPHGWSDNQFPHHNRDKNLRCSCYESQAQREGAHID